MLLISAILGPSARALAQESTPVAPAAASPVVAAQAATTKQAPTAEQIRAAVAALDDDSFRARQFALTRLNGWIALPEAQAPLAEALQAILLDPKTSFEVRTVCAPLLAQLPPVETKPTGAPLDRAELDRLIGLCDADSFSVRAGAAVRLAWLAKRDAKFAYEVDRKLKSRLADAKLSPEIRERFASISEAARGAWLASDPADWPRAEATDAQVEGWIAAMRKPVVDKASRLAVDHAERELFDLLAHDDEVTRVRALLEKHIPLEAAKADTPMPVVRVPQDFAEQQAEFDAMDRLERMLEWTKPAMVAEIWFDHNHRWIQYLQIGVPQYPENTDINPRATHFDRIDDKTTHCVSGNSLAPGEYPVGVALPPNHPLNTHHDGRMFHLVNLSTPRRRLLYENYKLKVNEAQRLAEITERTTAWLAAQKRTLTEREIMMFSQLDPVIVSRFVGPYLAATDDAPRTERPEADSMIGRNSRHAQLCLMLWEMGTHECLAGLADAIRRGRVPGLTEGVICHVGWLSALTIADRDPWEGLDEWLAGLIDRDDALLVARANPPDVGATAAAMLLARHGVSISEFGLIEATNNNAPGTNFTLCRFDAPERREQVLKWWKQRRVKPAA
jgi:hypothetical protein